jgi:hypothetical protein
MPYKRLRGLSYTFLFKNKTLTKSGSLERPGWSSGVGLVVLDANDHYRFVKRIPTWEYAASMSPEQVSGVAANPVTNLIYVAARREIR